MGGVSWGAWGAQGRCLKIVQEHEPPPQYCPAASAPLTASEPMDIARLIQSAVAPVFLLTGVAATLGVLTNRLARIVDRARTLEQRLEGHPGRGAHLPGAP